MTNTYEPNRDVLTSKQNRVTTGPNANSIVSQYDYTVNAIGQRTARTQSGTAFDGIGYASGTQLSSTMTGVPGSGMSTDIFTYNSRGEVINSINSTQSALARSYTCDPIGNRLATTEGELNNPATDPNAKTYTSNPLNQYTQITTTVPTPPTTALPTYDDDGNLLTDGTGKNYTWDCENRLTQVTLPNSGIVRYTYDANHRRVKREQISISNSRITQYYYDGWNVINENTQNTNAENENNAETYGWGLDLSGTICGAGGAGGLLWNKIEFGSGVQMYNYSYDANGNTGELLTSVGEVFAHYEYDAFGKNSLFIGIFSQTNVYRFNTKSFDSESNLYYYGYRFYSQELGKWLSRDPLQEDGGLNLYCFARNNPVLYNDFLGLFPLPIDFIPQGGCFKFKLSHVSHTIHEIKGNIYGSDGRVKKEIQKMINDRFPIEAEGGECEGCCRDVVEPVDSTFTIGPMTKCEKKFGMTICVTLSITLRLQYEVKICFPQR